MKQFTSILIIASLLTGCIQTKSGKGSDEIINKVISAPAPVVSPNQVVSLSGEVLPEKQLNQKTRQERFRKMENARRKYEKDPQNIENIIWYGRRLAYLGQFKDAIRIFSVGLDLKPDSYRLLRHRGHRYITTREFDLAIEDLQKAVFYARTAENSIEPDGLPNRKNIPLSNDKFNIWYHLGIAFYLKGNYDKAISSFKHCLEYADNDDLLAANVDWFYMTYRKIGNLTAAEELLKSVDRRLSIIENYSYSQRIRLYLDKADISDLFDQAIGANGSLEPTLAYGAANWQLYNGQVELAKGNLTKILKHPSWDSFAYIASEADIIAIGNLEK